MSNENKGVPAIWPKGNKRPNWSLLFIYIGLLLLGYFYGEHRTQRKWETTLERMIKNDTIEIGNNNIPLGLTEEKRKEILGAMESAKLDREIESDNDREANR